MASGIKDFYYTFASKWLSLLLVVAGQSILAWSLGPGGRGSYAVCVVFSSLLTMIFTIVSDSANTFMVASRRMTLSEGLFQGLLFAAIGSVLAIVTGLLVLQTELEFFKKADRFDFYLVLMSLPFTKAYLAAVHLLSAIRRFDRLAIFAVLHSFIHLVLMALFIWGFGWGVSGAVASNLVGGAICLVIVLVYLRLAHGIQWTRPKLAHSKEMLSYGLRNYLGKISNKTDKRVGAILLAFFATKEEIGLFSIAYILTAKVMVLPDTLSTVLLPRVAANQRTRHPLVAKCVRLTLVICGAALFLLVLAVEPVVRILFSSEFLPAVPLIQILAIGMLLRSASKVFVPYLDGTNHPGTASLSVFLGTITNLAFLWFLLPVLGLSAAAWGVTASYIVSASILLLAFRKISGMSIPHIARFESSDWTEMKTHVLDFKRRLLNRIGTRVDPTTGAGV